MYSSPAKVIFALLISSSLVLSVSGHPAQAGYSFSPNQDSVLVEANGLGDFDAITKGQRSNLRSGPGLEYSVISSFRNGARLNILGKSRDSRWYKVQARYDNSVGWMQTANIIVDEMLPPISIIDQASPQGEPKLPNSSSKLGVAAAKSKISNPFVAQTEVLAKQLELRMDQFQLQNLGITSTTMASAFSRSDTGDRVNALVREVWGEWTKVVSVRGGNVISSDPADNKYGLSPFRQLVVRLIQQQPIVLKDSQQHAIHNYFTRAENSSVWNTSMDGVIAAVNRESFLWP